MHSKNCIAADQRPFVQVVRAPPKRDARLLLPRPILDFHGLNSSDRGTDPSREGRGILAGATASSSDGASYNAQHARYCGASFVRWSK